MLIFLHRTPAGQASSLWSLGTSASDTPSLTAMSVEETFLPPGLPPCAKVHHQDLWYIGVFLDAIATLAGTGGKQLLRFAVVKNNLWYYPLGLVCTAIIDPLFDVSAYAYAAQSIISPMYCGADTSVAFAYPPAGSAHKYL